MRNNPVGKKASRKGAKTQRTARSNNENNNYIVKLCAFAPLRQICRCCYQLN
jgi:hypothetical protein